MYDNRVIKKTQAEFYHFNKFITSEDYSFFSIEFIHRYKHQAITTLIELVDRIVVEENWPEEVKDRLYFDPSKCYFDYKNPLSSEVNGAIRCVKRSIKDPLRLHVAHLALNHDSAIYIQVLVSAELNLTIVVCTEERVFDEL